MIAAPQIQVATLADLDALARLRAEIGWHRSDPLLRGVLSWDGGRIFVVRAGSLAAAHGSAAQEPAATTSAIAAGPLGVIGNVSVRPEFQRRGLGRLLTTHALAWQRAQGVRSVWLDATPAGRPLYRQLGFADIATSWYVHTPLRNLHMERLAALAGPYEIDSATPQALDDIAELDREAFGGDRLGLLRALASQSACAVYVARASDGARQRPLGYALTRRSEEPGKGIRLGPLVAPDDTVAAALALAVTTAELRRFPDEVTSGASYLTVGGGAAPAARNFFDMIGAATVDDDLVMRLSMADYGEASATHNDHTAPMGREKGKPSVYCWISPMLF